MSGYLDEVNYEERETRREARERHSEERYEMRKENPTYCQAKESGFEKCRNQCQLCKDIQDKLKVIE